MRNRNLVTSILLLFAGSLSGCFGNDNMSDLDALAKNAKESSNSSGQCPVGKWGSPTCSSGSGKQLIFFFGKDGTGYTSNPDCNSICTDLLFRFTYTVSGSTISYTFTSADDVRCSSSTSRPNLPSPRGPYNITYTCGNNGNQLTTQTSGSQSSATFTRLQ